MKSLIVLCMVAMAVAQVPQLRQNPNPQEAQILRYENINGGLGNYRYAFEQSDGTTHEQQGELKNQGRDDEAIVIRGRYSWVGPDGVTYVVTYTADENGYRPEIEQGPGGAVPGAVVASLLG